MELIDLSRCFVGVLALISLGVVAVVSYTLIRNARRRILYSNEQSLAEQTAVAKARLPQPLTLPELIAEAADTPRDERLINAAASTMKTLSGGMQDAVWVAVVPHQFNAELLAALRPDWGALAKDVYERLARLWFVSAMPDGSCVQSVIRRAMLHHLARKEELRESYLRHSLRAAKYFHARMVGQSEVYGRRNARFVSDTFFRFLPPNSQSPQDAIEWLYHLAVADPTSARPALQQLGDAWLAAGRLIDLQDLVDALREHSDDDRLTADLCALAYFYAGRVALRGNRVRDALLALEQARRLSPGDPLITNRIYQAMSEALDMLTSPDRSLTPDSSVWSSLTRPTADRTHWGLWADLHLPQPGDDGLRRTHEMLLVYESSHNLSGAALAKRLIGDDHCARGDYRNALDWYQSSYATLLDAARREGELHSHLLDEAITLKALGDTLYLMGRAHEALRKYDESLQVHARLPGDELHEADAHKAKGDVLHFLGQYPDALPEYELALATYRQGGAVISEGETLLAQGRLLQTLNRQDEAQRCYDEALGIYRRCASSIGVANALLVIGSSAQLRGQAALAMQHFEEALNIYRKQKSEAGEAAALKALGDAHVQLRQFDQALPCYTEAREQFETAGLRRNLAETELALGHLHRQESAYLDAMQHYQRALDQFSDIHDRRGEADARLAMGIVQDLRREDEEARRLITEALGIYRQVHDRQGEAQATRCLGEACLTVKDYTAALINFQAALSLWREIGDPLGAVEELYGRVGHALALIDHTPEAARTFELAAEKHSPREFGWLGWRDIVTKEFANAVVHFTAVQNRDQAVAWQVGQALAQLACGDRIGAERQMEAGLRHADPQELGEACRWIEVVARCVPELNLKAEQFGLMC